MRQIGHPKIIQIRSGYISIRRTTQITRIGLILINIWVLISPPISLKKIKENRKPEYFHRIQEIMKVQLNVINSV